MAATVQVRRHTGAASGGDGGTTRTDITSINTRASVVDTHSTNDTANPIPIPAAGTNYSVWVSTRLYTSDGPTGTIDNLQWWQDDTALGTGVACVMATASTSTDEGYRIATTGPPTVLNQTNHTGLDEAPVAISTYHSGNHLSYTGSVTGAGADEIGDFIVYQFQISSTASAGATGNPTFTFQYDET